MALTASEPDHGARGIAPAGSLILVIIFCVGIMVLDHRFNHLDKIRAVLAGALYPVQIMVNAPGATARWFDETFASRESLAEENSRLRSESLLQNARLQRLETLEAENQRLRALLDSTAKISEDVLVAEILSVDMDPFRHRVLLNRGTGDGAFVGQPIIDADGIVGQITRDQPFAAEAILITDANHALPVEILRNQLRTIAVGTGDIDNLSLPYLPRNADVREGDLIITSGLGGTFPPGYPVGRVKRINSTADAAFLEISATPASALNRVREVLLLKPSEKQEMAPMVAESNGAEEGQ